MSVGLNFVFWAMLPNTIEYGERATGLHVEGTVFGVAALLQRIAIGIATAILGWGFATAGYVPNVQQSAETLSSMRMTVAIAPLASSHCHASRWLLNPLGRRRASARSRRCSRLGDQLEGSVHAFGLGRRRDPQVERARLDHRPSLRRRRRGPRARSVKRTICDSPGASAIFRNAFSSRTGRVTLASGRGYRAATTSSARASAAVCDGAPTSDRAVHRHRRSA